MEITELLLHAKRSKASDLHLSAGYSPVVRIFGDITPLQLPPLQADDIRDILFSIFSEDQRIIYEREKELDFSIQFGDNLRFRVNAFTTINGPAISFRDIPSKVYTLDELGMPKVLKRLAGLRKGLVLVTGPTGSGKSVTLAAMVDYINNNFRKHILTVEDPVEIIHKPSKCLINQREVGNSTKSFARALKSALREDPDVILVGELRDLETIQLALTAAETGHLVLATLHTNSAAKTIDRVIDVFPPHDKAVIMSMLSTSLEGIIAQTLIKTKDGKGRTAALEVMLATPAIRNLIREGKMPQIFSLMQVGSRVGMRTMKDSVYNLLEKGIISDVDAKQALNMYEDKQDVEDDDTGDMDSSVGINSEGGF